MRRRPPRSPARALVAWAAALALLAPGAPRVASADGLADEAELHFQLGAEAYQKGDFRGALEHFLASNRLVPNRNVVFNIARAFEQMKQLPDAHRYYVDALAGETDPEVVADIDAALARIAPGVAVLDVVTTPPGATIYIDRKDLGSRGLSPRPLGLPQGSYTVIAELPGYEAASSSPVAVKAGEKLRVELTLRRIVGMVHVDVEGADRADVRVDDEQGAVACSAPCDAEVPPGPHVLYFAREGFSAAPRQVNVVAKERARVAARMSPLTGALVVSADEQGALVEVDGKPMGFTPVVIQSVAVGRRRVVVALHGYAPVERDVDVEPGQQAELLELRLTPIREVTAVSRLAEDVDDAPSSLTILDGRELRAFAYPTIAEALRGVRGVYLNDDGSYVSAGIRGLGQPNDYGNRVLVLSDGQSLNDDIINSSYISTDARVDLHDVDRIEVVRGPGSLLYGTGAVSGVVNLVPRPRDEPDGVHAGGGVFGPATSARAGFHYGFGRDAGLWASVSGGRSEGRDVPLTLRDPAASAPVTAHGVDRFESGGTAGRAWWGPLTAQWFFHTRKLTQTQGAYQTIVDDPRTTATDTRMMAEVRFEPQLSRAVQLMTRAHANRYTYGSTLAYEPSPAATNAEDYAGTWLGGEARLVITPRPGLRVSAGGEAQAHTQAAIDGCCVAGADYIHEDRPFNFGAGYALLEASPARWVRFSGGARLDVYSTSGAIVVPRAGLIFRPNEGGVLKLMGGRAFRAPSVYERFYTDGLTQVPAEDPATGRTLAPESLYQGEIEYSIRLRQDWVALAAAHVGVIHDIIDTVPDTPGGAVVRYANSDHDVVVAGGDLELRREWRRGYMLDATASYERARYAGSTLSDPRVVNAPQWLASFRGVAPLLPELVSGALRMTLEAPRRISLDGDDKTGTAIVADVVVSGRARSYGLEYAVGLYNVADWTYELPTSDVYATRTLRQRGRTLRADLVVTYP